MVCVPAFLRTEVVQFPFRREQSFTPFAVADGDDERPLDIDIRAIDTDPAVREDKFDD